ncbi:MAG: D-2-hydroxyacid dehydrogenase family protein [Beijerinckiaceae bacterium]|nr:D-2-hydroxyacid dehydrogenase family protein [Beijerinckiaceae bacterium]
MTIRMAVLDDYLDAVRASADWGSLGPDVEITVFNRNLATVDEAAQALKDFEVLSLMRERMALPKALIDRLPNLKLVITTGGRNRSIDVEACKARGIVVCGTRSADPAPTIEIAWGLILSAARNLAREDAHMRRGGWQERMGFSLHGKTLGIVGLGHLGKRMAEVGQAFGMNVVAWSENLTAERAAEAGVRRVDKDELMSGSDVITIHLVLSDRTRGLIGAREFGLMKPTAIIANTSRGPIIDEAAMVDALRAKRILAACLDVYNVEPLPSDHVLRTLENAVLSPHLGYATQGNYSTYYADTIEAVQAWRAGASVPRVIES